MPYKDIPHVEHCILISKLSKHLKTIIVLLHGVRGCLAENWRKWKQFEIYMLTSGKNGQTDEIKTDIFCILLVQTTHPEVSIP